MAIYLQRGYNVKCHKCGKEMECVDAQDFDDGSHTEKYVCDCGNIQWI